MIDYFMWLFSKRGHEKQLPSWFMANQEVYVILQAMQNIRESKQSI